MTWFGFARGQFLLSWRVFWRNRRTMFIGFVLPLGLAALIASPLKEKEIGGVSAAAYVSVGFMGFAMVTSFIALLNGLVTRRDDLVLKRFRTTAVPASAVLAGQIAAQAAALLVQVGLLAVLMVTRFDAPAPADPLLLVAALLVGYLTFALLAVALSGITPGAESAPFVALPVLLLSMFGAAVFQPLSGLPEWAMRLLHALPLGPVIEVLRTAWFGRDFTTGSEVWGTVGLPETSWASGWTSAAGPLLVVLAWAAAATAVSRRWFRWEPRRA
ncbi:MAG: ABC transporter permease [Kineosporiaceae bacterium]